LKHIVALLLAVVYVVPAFAGEGRVRRSGKPVPGQYIVVLNEDAHERAAVADEMSRRFGTRTRFVFAGFPGFSFEGNEHVAQAIARDPRVAWVEENTEAELLQVANTTTRPFPPGWALDRTDQALPPLDGFGGPGCSTASGIRLYVMDTGINDIDGTEFGTRLRDLYMAAPSWDIRDSHGHGTAVASMAGGRRHGLARSAEIVNVKVVNPNGTTETVINGISRIDVDHYNRNLNNTSPRAAVVNVSLYFRSGEWTAAELSALDLAVQNSVRGCTSVVVNPTTGVEECTSFNTAPAAYGLTYVVGAGNNNTAVNGSPARLGDDTVGTITVGATRMLDEWTTDWRGIWGTLGSNWGPEVDIWAPGTDNDVARHVYDATNTVTRKESGTSIASPLVAGQVARLAASYTWYTTQQLETQLKSGGTSTKADGTPLINDVPSGTINLMMRFSAGKCRSVGS
jgi:serine protease